MTTKRVAIYARVSTDGQTVENQLRELRAVAKRQGWKIAKTFSDNGVSGAKGRDKRRGFDDLCTGIARRDFDMVAAWSVDRLGRSLQHLVTFLGELQAKDVDLYLHQQGLDTSTPAGRLSGCRPRPPGCSRTSARSPAGRRTEPLPISQRASPAARCRSCPSTNPGRCGPRHVSSCDQRYVYRIRGSSTMYRISRMNRAAT